MKTYSERELTQLVSIYELPEFETPDDSVFGSLQFVLQTIRFSNGLYSVRLLRKEKVNVEPAYLSSKEGLLETMTIEVLVADDLLADVEISEVEEHLAIKKAIFNLNNLLGASL
jgi:hypothetical protein